MTIQSTELNSGKLKTGVSKHSNTISSLQVLRRRFPCTLRPLPPYIALSKAPDKVLVDAVELLIDSCRVFLRRRRRSTAIRTMRRSRAAAPAPAAIGTIELEPPEPDDASRLTVGLSASPEQREKSRFTQVLTGAILIDFGQAKNFSSG